LVIVFASLVWYVGWLAAFAGLMLLVRPVARLRVPTRRRAAAILVAGILLAWVAIRAGISTVRVSMPVTIIDRFAPAYQFNEAHAITIDAPAGRVYRALYEVTPEEISFYRTLTWIRRSGRDGRPGLLNPPRGRPILETALASGFYRLDEIAGVELAFGTLLIAPPGAARKPWTADMFAALAEPGYAKVVMNFRVESRTANRCELRTETRIFATDDASRRTFAPYWRTIYPGSALIRRMWLRAIKARAERLPDAGAASVSLRR
jgi:hypothetical protein